MDTRFKKDPNYNFDEKSLDLSWKMFSNIPSVIKHHWVTDNYNWEIVNFFSIVHITAFFGLFRLKDCSPETLLFSFIIWPITGWGVTVGAHRLWAHRTYEAHFLLRLFLMLANSVAYQGTIYDWATNHRIHHLYTETDADPHNSTRGFFFSHIGWLLLKPNPATIEAQKKLDRSDLWDDPLVRIQHQCDPYYIVFAVFFFPASVAYYGWGENYVNAMLVAGSIRYCLMMHSTFLVNSAAHLWGDRPYDSDGSFAVESPMVSFLCLGEGWHNWHHKYPFDYAASEFGISVQWNVSKLFIDIMAKLGLVWGRKRATAAWELTRERRRRQGISGNVTTNPVPLPKKILVDTKSD